MFIKGDGFKGSTDKFGRSSAEQGTIKLTLFKTNHVMIISNFDDNGLIKEAGGRFDGESYPKHWWISLSSIREIVEVFDNATIDDDVLEAYEKKFDRPYCYKKPARTEWNGTVPDTFKGTLFEYQKAGATFLWQNQYSILGMATGLGKTPTALATASYILADKPHGQFLIVVPNSVKYQWASEIQKFTTFKVVVLNASTTKKFEASWEQADTAQFVIVNYEFLRSAKYAPYLKDRVFTGVIADEAHRLKNYKAQLTKRFHEFFLQGDKASEFVWLLTATPFPNAQPRETYTMLSHVAPSITGNWFGFARQYVVMESFRIGHMTVNKPVRLKNHEKLQQKMADKVFLRTHRSEDVEVALPTERHSQPRLSLSVEETKAYQQLKNQFKTFVEGLDKKTFETKATETLAWLKKLEQIALDMDMLLPDGEVDLVKLSTKEQWTLDTISEYLEDEDNRGVVIFSESKLPLKKLKKGFNDLGIPADIIDGSVPDEKRNEIVNRFNKGNIKVLLGTSAMEEGLNLQMGGHTMVHLDIPWVPKSITQREGRILRTGQPSTFTFFLHPIMENTIEEYKLGKIRIKIEEITKLLGAGSAGSAEAIAAAPGSISFGLDEIREMLGLPSIETVKKSVTK